MRASPDGRTASMALSVLARQEPDAAGKREQREEGEGRLVDLSFE